jgi:hypothetical protein
MKTRELIEKLSQLDGDLDINFDTDCTVYDRFEDPVTLAFDCAARNNDTNTIYLYVTDPV